MVAQAYYESEWPLGPADADGSAPGSFTLTAGKLELFSFFDGNRVTSNEAGQFINTAFLHNPLLDAGGARAYKYGFMPGVRAAYGAPAGPLQLGASLGVFGSGLAADFSAAPRRPLVIAQPTCGTHSAGERHRASSWFVATFSIVLQDRCTKALAAFDSKNAALAGFVAIRAGKRGCHAAIPAEAAAGVSSAKSRADALYLRALLS